MGEGGQSAAPRRPWLSQRTGAVVGAGSVLVALVAYLLWANYREASRNRQQVLAQHQAAFRLHAAALAHLLGSAGEELRLPPSEESEGAVVDLDAEGSHLIVARPLWFRGRKVGKLVAWVRRQALRPRPEEPHRRDPRAAAAAEPAEAAAPVPTAA